jgi:hypothetical protein
VVLKRYAPDINQAIHRPVSAYLLTHPPFAIAISLVLGTLTNQVDEAYRRLNPSCR